MVGLVANFHLIKKEKFSSETFLLRGVDFIDKKRCCNDLFWHSHLNTLSQAIFHSNNLVLYIIIKYFDYFKIIHSSYTFLEFTRVKRNHLFFFLSIIKINLY